jgi:uncharacterized membrane protein YdjX (TVP38/TMEM64 family)
VTFVPITLLVAATVLLFEPLVGTGLALAGAVVAGAAGWVLGRVARGRTVRRLGGVRLMWLRGQLRRRGARAICIARLLPFGSFASTSALAGALRVPFGTYLLATAAGVLPGLAGLALLIDRLRAAARAPTVTNFVLVALMIGVIAGALGRLRRALQREPAPIVIPPPQQEAS